MFVVFTLIFLLSVVAGFVGMVFPRIYARFSRQDVSRKKIAQFFGAALFGSFVLMVITVPPVEEKSTETVTETEISIETNQDAAVAEQENGIETQSTITSKVVKVVDGDTVTVETNGVRETIRIIGINTPETVDPRKPVECFGKEASSHAHALLDNQTVTLEADETQGDRDKYDRLLRYVFLSDGSDFGKQMISEGYAYEYTYSNPYTYQQDYKTSQSDAKNAKRGLWADGACGNVANDAGDTQKTSSSVPETTESAASPTTESCSCSANTYNCGDFSTHAEAQALYACCMAQVGRDVHALDGPDNDGLACESLP